MDEKKFDDMISKGLKKGTDSFSGMKDQVWSNIERKMIEHDYKEQQEKGSGVSRMSTYKKKRKSKGMFAVASVAVVLVVALVTFNTETGEAFISQIRQMFEPEKQIVEEIEGMEEETDTQLHENETPEERASDYVIYVDEERYAVSKNGDIQRIEAKIDGDYPDVYMEISQEVDRKPEDIVEELRQKLSPDYDRVSEVTPVEEPVHGFRISAHAGQEWNSEVIVYYVFSNELGGSFVAKQVYFFEASEGHGVRMDNMLKHFEIVGE
ncbi:hypothetical protein [Bacillus horti]|uniref:DUF4367 domain-containing protein n=1 Tax=Caldalkalibacillus horti TaxID=77523 RepID=A0ABT9W1Z0_9BACI|nr:hypothetical protein [Bacillus horti]MDQ0167264.1 hypothetical protein [Bacillus horti]